MESKQAQTYQNIMELLVAKEVERQLEQFPPRLARYIAKTEVETYALNRLPPLYASSREGFHQQELRGRNQLKTQISTTVRQALAAIQQDPIRLSTPLEPQDESEAAEAALQELRSLLQRGDLSWQNLVEVIKQVLARTAQSARMSHREEAQQYSNQPPSPPVTPQRSAPPQQTRQRNVQRTRDHRDLQRSQDKATKTPYGWGDSFYDK